MINISKRAAAGIVAATAVGAGIALAAGGTGSNATQPAGASRPTATATPAAQPVPVQPEPTQDPMQAWCAGPGYTAEQAVQQDLSNIQYDATGNDTAVTESDGAQMASDAETAVNNMPPIGNQAKLKYGLAMGWLLVSGHKASAGDFAGAASAEQTADGYLNQDAGVLSCP